MTEVDKEVEFEHEKLFALAEKVNRQVIRAGWFALALIVLLTAEFAATGNWPLVGTQLPSLIAVVFMLRSIYSQQAMERRTAAFHQLAKRLDATTERVEGIDSQLE